MRLKLLLMLCVIFVASVPARVLADPLPPFDGVMAFHAIQSPEAPEEFSWEVKLDEEQELRAVDDRHASVVYPDYESLAFVIEAAPAHDAEGATVPTTLTVTQPNIITLTVHHRDGNPAAGGAPFDYPVSPGKGWEGGLRTEEVVLTPGDQPQPPPTCVVPDLTNRTLRASRKILHRAHCKLGRVRGERRREVRVTQQYRPVGKVLPLWTTVDVKALQPDQYSRTS
jgi:hypothetical protein